MKLDYDMFRVLNLLQENNQLTQRNIGEMLNISLGKTNMLLKDLIEGGRLHLVMNHGKSRYYLTEQGIDLKNELNQSFLSDCLNVMLEFKTLVKETIIPVIDEHPFQLLFLGNSNELARLIRMALLELKQERKIQYTFVTNIEALIDLYQDDQSKVFIWEKSFEDDLKTFEIQYAQLLSPYYPKRCMDLNFNGILH